MSVGASSIGLLDSWVMTRLGNRAASLKRLFDILSAGALIVLFSPVLVATALAVRIVLGRPVLFSQLRPGLDEKPFTVLKFRTMRDDRSADGSQLSDDKRMTRLGSFLRSTSIDELPALFNVIKGDMSLVGPRPLLMEYLPLYSDQQRRRHEVRPGLTGWAQVNGRNLLSWPDKFALDVWYVENQSFWLDIKILLMTVVKVLRREGISQSNHATMEPFRGNH